VLEAPVGTKGLALMFSEKGFALGFSLDSDSLGLAGADSDPAALAALSPPSPLPLSCCCSWLADCSADAAAPSSAAALVDDAYSI
jgi:hypothetical protein